VAININNRTGAATGKRRARRGRFERVPVPVDASLAPELDGRGRTSLVRSRRDNRPVQALAPASRRKNAKAFGRSDELTSNFPRNRGKLLRALTHATSREVYGMGGGGGK